MARKKKGRSINPTMLSLAISGTERVRELTQAAFEIKLPSVIHEAILREVLIESRSIHGFLVGLRDE
jgi:hypothetical protein